MGVYLNPGNGMFQITLNDLFYVDKTKLAVFMNERLDTPRKFVCVSRPRRFGKSVDADMLVAYYTRGADSRAQFAGLDVVRDPSFEQHLNAHDVVKLDMTQMLSFAENPVDIPKAVTGELLPEFRAQWPGVIPEDVPTLAKALELVFAAGCSDGIIFVIDEWDCVMREAEGDERAQKRYLDFLRDVLKGRVYVKACYMTGILPIRKYGRHSALNIFMEYSMTSPGRLARLTGFNADEVERLCAEFGMPFDEMARWYDGYVLHAPSDSRPVVPDDPGDPVHVYNPRSVSAAIAERRYGNYWTSTETYEALQRYIDIDFDGVAGDLMAMLGGERVEARVEGFNNSMTDFRDKDDVYALLVHLGYLGYDAADRAVFVPNEEIRLEFVNALRGGSRPALARLAGESRKLLRATVDGDAGYVAAALQEAHSWAAGPRYYNDEQALRAAVKFAYIAAMDDYLRVDELPGGRGYCDVALVPKPGSALPPVLVELKWGKPVEAALAQARARDYPAAFAGLGGDVVLVGVTYDEDTCEHRCEIERVEL